jgi:hypothetical protein
MAGAVVGGEANGAIATIRRGTDNRDGAARTTRR